jgi:hypothetical protein
MKLKEGCPGLSTVICCASGTVEVQQASELSNSYVNSQLPWHHVALDSEGENSLLVPRGRQFGLR